MTQKQKSQPNLFGIFKSSTKDIYGSKCIIKKPEKSEINNSVMKLRNRKIKYQQYPNKVHEKK